MRANQLAMVAGEAMAAVGTDLAMVVDWKRVPVVGAGPGRAWGREADRTTL